jgi:nicotinamide mononucleotide transporter
LKAISALEIAAVGLALVYLILAAYQNIWCWLAAALSSVIYIKICYDAQLFIETGLQFFYLIMAIVGYFNWNNKNQNSEASIRNLKPKEWMLGLLICGVISFIMAFWFQQNTSAKLPWLDAPVTIFSVWATWLVIKKVIENWLLWVIIDSVAIYIYTQRELSMTAYLYALYTLLAIVGYFKWKKEQQISLK